MDQRICGATHDVSATQMNWPVKQRPPCPAILGTGDVAFDRLEKKRTRNGSELFRTYFCSKCYQQLWILLEKTESSNEDIAVLSREFDQTATV